MADAIISWHRFADWLAECENDGLFCWLPAWAWTLPEARRLSLKVGWDNMFGNGLCAWLCSARVAGWPGS